MCSIIGSFNKNTFVDLVKINQHRGSFSFSISTIIDNNILLSKNFGIINTDILDTISSGYILGHIQAPTGGSVKDFNRVHPAELNNSKLWHNGIITPRGIKFCQDELNTTETFDTKLLLMMLDKYGFDILSKIEGLFACVYYNNSKFYVFRTKHGKLYIDTNLSISSEYFNNSKCINYDTIYNIDFNLNIIKPILSFKTLKYNIIVPGEM